MGRLILAINLPSIKDADYVAKKREWMKRVEDEGTKLLKEVREGVAKMIA